MALTRPTSKTVGPRLKTRALRTKEMPRVPRSIALESAPVCRLRWNPRSRLCRWRKTFLAMRRMELWATLPNTVFLSSLNNAAQARDPPSGMNRGDEDLNSCCEKQEGSDKEAPRQRKGTYCILIPNNRSEGQKRCEATKENNLCGLVICNTMLTICDCCNVKAYMSWQRPHHLCSESSAGQQHLKLQSWRQPRYYDRPAHCRHSKGRVSECTSVSRILEERGGTQWEHWVETWPSRHRTDLFFCMLPFWEWK